MVVFEGDLYVVVGVLVMFFFSFGERVQCFLLSIQLLFLGICVFQGLEEFVVFLQILVVVFGEVFFEDVDYEGKGSFLKMFKIKFLLFRWFLKKEIGLKVDLECSVEDLKFSLVLDKDEVVLQFVIYMDLFFERDGEKGRSIKFGFVMLKFVFFKMKVFKSGVSLLQRDVDFFFFSVIVGGSF